MSKPNPLLEKSFPMRTLTMLLVLCLVCVGCGQAHGNNPSHGPTQQPTSRSVVSSQPSSVASSVTGNQIQFLHMNSERSGWAITGNGEVAHTTDSGKTWKKVLTSAILQQERVSPGGPQPGYFPNAATAWIIAGTYAGGGGPLVATGLSIYHTTDTGQHWQKAALKDFDDCRENPDLTFSDSLHGWLLCHLSPGMSHEEKDLFSTKDGGQIWTKVAGVGPGSSHAISVSGYATGLTFRDALTGWMSTVVPASNCLDWSVTHDGGATWQEQVVPALCTKDTQPVMSYPGVFFDQQHGVIPVGIGFADANNPAYMYVTSNGGQTWRQLPAVNARASTVAYSDADHAWIVSDDRKTLYATSDGGQHWQPRSKKFGGTVLDFVTTHTGWAIGDGTLLKTTDGGQNWMPLTYTLSG